MNNINDFEILQKIKSLEEEVNHIKTLLSIGGG